MKLVFVTLLTAAGLAFAAEPAKKEEKKADVKPAATATASKKEEAKSTESAKKEEKKTEVKLAPKKNAGKKEEAPKK